MTWWQQRLVICALRKLMEFERHAQPHEIQAIRIVQEFVLMLPGRIRRSQGMD